MLNTFAGQKCSKNCLHNVQKHMKNHKGDDVPSSLVSIFSQHSNCCLVLLSWPYSTTTILNLKPSAIRAWKDHRFGSFHKQSFIEKVFRIRRTYYYLLCFQISLVLGQTRKMYSKLIINDLLFAVLSDFPAHGSLQEY